MAEMNLNNARDPEQVRRMEELQKKGECHFCGDISSKHTAPIILSTDHWLVTANDFPYLGAVHHYLIVSKTHIRRMSEIVPEARIELFSAIEALENHLKVSGASIFVRSGDMSYTGATLDHLHFHFLVGASKPENAVFPEDFLLVTLAFKQKT